jgi:hypothetical protein
MDIMIATKNSFNILFFNKIDHLSNFLPYKINIPTLFTCTFNYDIIIDYVLIHYKNIAST